ncbi:MAG: hypothetical protein RIG77_14585 [Cyclobacteriaceae bacterium]
MESLQIEILNPKAKKLIEDLAALDLISIVPKSDSKEDFFKMLEKVRTKGSDISLEEITKEVEAVRAKRYAKKGA